MKLATILATSFGAAAAAKNPHEFNLRNLQGNPDDSTSIIFDGTYYQCYPIEDNGQGVPSRLRNLEARVIEVEGLNEALKERVGEVEDYFSGLPDPAVFIDVIKFYAAAKAAFENVPHDTRVLTGQGTPRKLEDGLRDPIITGQIWARVVDINEELRVAGVTSGEDARARIGGAALEDALDDKGYEIDHTNRAGRRAREIAAAGEWREALTTSGLTPDEAVGRVSFAGEWKEALETSGLSPGEAVRRITLETFGDTCKRVIAKESSLHSDSCGGSDDSAGQVAVTATCPAGKAVVAVFNRVEYECIYVGDECIELEITQAQYEGYKDTFYSCNRDDAAASVTCIWIMTPICSRFKNIVEIVCCDAAEGY